MYLSTRRCLEGSSIAVLLVMVVASSAAAQTPAPTGAASARRVSFGVIGGLNSANLTLPLELLPEEFSEEGLEISTGRRIGWVGGLFVAVPVTPRLAFETGGIVNNKGVSLDITAPGIGSASGGLRLTYLDLPLLARIELTRGSRRRLYLLTGPTTSVNMSARVYFSDGGASASEAAEGFPRMDFGWTAGGRLTLDRLLFEVRYDHGLRNLAEGDPGVTIKNRAATALVGWQF